MNPALTHQERPEGAWLLAFLGGTGMLSLQAATAYLVLSVAPLVSVTQNRVWFYGEVLLHLLPAILVLAGAKILYAKPKHHLLCGSIILIAATIDYFALQPYNPWVSLPPAFLMMTNLPAAIGGVLALLWHPKQVLN